MSAIGAELASLKVGDNRGVTPGREGKIAHPSGTSIEEAATMLNVSPKPYTGEDLLQEALSDDLSQAGIKFVCAALRQHYDTGEDVGLLLDLRCGARSATSRARNAATSHRYSLRDGLLRAAWATITGDSYSRAKELHRVATDALERPDGFLPANETETLVALCLPMLAELGLPGPRQLIDILQR